MYSGYKWKIKVDMGVICSFFCFSTTTTLFSTTFLPFHHSFSRFHAFLYHNTSSVYPPPFSPPCILWFICPFPVVLHLLHFFSLLFLSLLSTSPAFVPFVLLPVFLSTLVFFFHLSSATKPLSSFPHRRRTGTCVGSHAWSWWWLPSSSSAGRQFISLSSSPLSSTSPAPRCRLSPGTSASHWATPTGTHPVDAGSPSQTSKHPRFHTLIVIDINSLNNKNVEKGPIMLWWTKWKDNPGSAPWSRSAPECNGVFLEPNHILPLSFVERHLVVFV